MGADIAGEGKAISRTTWKYHIRASRDSYCVGAVLEPKMEPRNEIKDKRPDSMKEWESSSASNVIQRSSDVTGAGTAAGVSL